MTYTKSSQHQTNGIRLFVYFLLALVLLIGFFDHRLSTIQLIAGCSLLVTELILNSNLGHQLVSQYPFLRMIPRLNVFFICIYPLLPSQSSISLGTILDILGCLLIFLLTMPVKKWIPSYPVLMIVSTMSVTLLILLVFYAPRKIVIDNPVQILMSCLPLIICLSVFLSVPWILKVLLHMKQERDGLSLSIGRNMSFDSKNLVRSFRFFNISFLLYRKERWWCIEITNTSNVND